MSCTKSVEKGVEVCDKWISHVEGDYMGLMGRYIGLNILLVLSGNEILNFSFLTAIIRFQS